MVLEGSDKTCHFISKVKSFCWKVNIFKFGLEVLVMVKYALILDKQNSNTLWQDAINKEKKNSHISFGILDRG